VLALVPRERSGSRLTWPGLPGPPKCVNTVAAISRHHASHSQSIVTRNGQGNDLSQ